MTTVRSLQTPFEMVDYTENLVSIPNTWGLVNQLGIFGMESVAQHSVTIEKIDQTLGLVTDKVRGERNNVNRDYTRQLLSFAIPHFPLDDQVTPQDIQGKRAYGNADAVETEAAVIARKLQRIRQNHAVTMEAARCQAITTGTVYAPNGTVADNYYTSFGITRKEIDFVLGTATTNVLSKSEEGIAHIQDNVLDGSVVNEIIVLASPEFFGKLVTQAGVVDAYKFYTSTQEPLRQRVGGMGLYREFVHGSIRYIEYRGVYNGQRLIPAGDAYMLPRGVSDMFITYCSPANKFTHVNTLGEEAYVFAYRNNTDDAILLQSEHNALHLIRRPAAVVRLFSSN